MLVSIYLFPGDQSVIQVREQSNISSILRRYIHPTHLYSTHTFIPRRYFTLYSGGISTPHTYTVHIHLYHIDTLSYIQEVYPPHTPVQYTYCCILSLFNSACILFPVNSICILSCMYPLL